MTTKILDDLAVLNRPQFFDGQRVAAPDLQGVEQLNREMRWLHNQSLHQPGVGNGYAITGLKGDRVVTVGPGYAIDADGREVVLTASQTLPVPPVAGEADGGPSAYDLVVSYPDDSALDPVETRAADCGMGRGTVRLRENPVFCWVYLRPSALQAGNLTVADPKQSDRIDKGQMVLLARVEVLNCQLNKDVVTSYRRSARPPQQPFIAGGQSDTPPPWIVNPLAAVPAAVPPAPVPFEAGGAAPAPAAAPTATAAAGLPPPVLRPFVAPYTLTANIKTPDAGFLSIPRYTARIAYPTGNQERIHTITLAPGPNQQTVFAFLEGVVNVTDSQTTHFTVEVLVIVVPLTPLGARLLEGARSADFGPEFVGLFKDWGVVWMGVEG